LILGKKWEVNPAAAGVPVDDRQWIAAYGPQKRFYMRLPGKHPAATLSSWPNPQMRARTFPQVVATFSGQQQRVGPDAKAIWLSIHIAAIIYNPRFRPQEGERAIYPRGVVVPEGQPTED